MVLPLDDPYEVLQVDPDAEREVIRAAYRTLARKYHPDVSAGSRDRMAALNHAWGILRNASTRAAYDQARAEA
jgi:curved DNA-binding protein CbpA